MTIVNPVTGRLDRILKCLGPNTGDPFMATFKPEHVNYEILECVGEGLTASVYKAVRTDSRGHSRQTVALKVLKDETAIPILRREFETLAKIRSLHCGRVLGWENDGDQAALVLEWIEGATIDRLAARFELSASEIEEITAQIARGLVDLRDQGLHHGDLHPRNVIVDVEGRVRLVDFGTAHAEIGIIRGVPAYLSPETWRGEGTTFASDLFALGLIVHDMKTGFAQVPTGASARKRCERLADSGSSLLHAEASERSIPRSSSSEDSEVTRAALGVLISRLLSEKSEIARTQILSSSQNEETRAWIKPIAASLLAVVSTLSISVRAEAPLELEMGRAALEIRTNRWVEVEINGHQAGFSPLSIKSLRPGIHRLRWRGSGGSGEARLALAAGRTLKLTEADLARLSGAVPR